MPATLQPTDRAADDAARPPAAATDVEAAVRLVDRTLHGGALLLRSAAYLALAAIAEHYPFGPHLLAGVLFGDFAGWLLLLALSDLQRRPAATIAQLALFSALFAAWWWRYDWPASAEFRALFALAGFGGMTARAGQWIGTLRGDNIWD